MIFNATKIDFKDIEKSLKVIIYVHEEVIKRCFIPGQVESWDVIYDLGGLGITELPTSTLKSVLGTIGANYGGRLCKLWVVNAPGTIFFSWKLVSAFLDPITV